MIVFGIFGGYPEPPAPNLEGARSDSTFSFTLRQAGYVGSSEWYSNATAVASKGWVAHESREVPKNNGQRRGRWTLRGTRPLDNKPLLPEGVSWSLASSDSTRPI